MMLHKSSDARLYPVMKLIPLFFSSLLFSSPLLCLCVSAELHPAQLVTTHTLCARAERGHRKELLVDAEPRRGQSRQGSTPPRRLHGQQHQVPQEQRTRQPQAEVAGTSRPGAGSREPGWPARLPRARRLSAGTSAAGVWVRWWRWWWKRRWRRCRRSSGGV